MSDKLKWACGEAEDRLASMMQEMHERGDLRHLHGKPLTLEEDDPAWLVARMLKQEGFSHPLLERRREVEKQLQAADARVERLLQRRGRLVDEQARTPPEIARAFNDGRQIALQEYQEYLVELNRSIRDYNLTVPTALHITPVRVDRHMERVQNLVSTLQPESFAPRRSDTSWWMHLRHGNRR